MRPLWPAASPPTLHCLDHAFDHAAIRFERTRARACDRIVGAAG